LAQLICIIPQLNCSNLLMNTIPSWRFTLLPDIVPKMEHAKGKPYGGIVGWWTRKKFGQYFRGSLQQKNFNSFVVV